jgi:hypothetical protein
MKAGRSLKFFSMGFYKDIAPTALEKYPEGIKSFSPALTDEIRLRWVVNHKLKSTLKGLNQIAVGR